jgi:predicted methyltransferase
MRVKIDDVRINRRRRPLDRKKARAIAESIKLIGLLNPITVTEDLTLISGRHRLEAHKILGLEEIEANIVGLADLTQDLAEIDENIIRNELNDIDMGEHLIDRDNLLDLLGIKARRGDNRYTIRRRPEIITGLGTNREMGKRIGMSERLIRIKKQIARGITTGNKERLRTTRFASNTTGLLEISKLDSATQDKVVDALLNGRYKNISRVIYRVQRDEKKREVIERISDLGRDPHEAFQVIHGDFIEEGDQIKDNSVDLILTDPPYLSENSLQLYGGVAELGKRVLKQGGSCLVYAYQSYLPSILSVMSKHLTYWWTISIAFQGKHSKHNQRGIFVEWKPLLFFVNGRGRLEKEVISDCIKGQIPEKIFHRWEQDTTECDYYIHHLTPSNGTVLDCMMGTGTVGISCVRMGRNFIGIETDKERFEIASKRINESLLIYSSHFTPSQQSASAI